MPLSTLSQRFTQFKKWLVQTTWKNKLLVIIIPLVVLWFARPLVLQNKTNTPQYQTAVAEKGTLVESVTVSGTVSSLNSTAVTTDASGVVEEVYVKNGDYVEAGQAIAKLSLDQSSLQKQASAYATYLSAVNLQKTAQQNKLAADASMWQSQQSVLDAQNNVNVKNSNNTNPSTKQEYTDLEKQSIESSLIQAQKSFAANETKYKEADSAINSAGAQVNAAWIAYQQTSSTITAPISGTISNVSYQVGTIIPAQSGSSSSGSSSNTSSSAQKIGVIKTNSLPTVSVNLTEIDVPKVKVGNKATITFDAFPNKTYTGKVISIDTTGSVSSGVTTYPTIISLDLPPENLYPNMSASASIITNTKDNVVMIPSAAVQTQNDESTVRVLKNGVVQTVTVETGIANDTDIEIISGISEGDTVITGQTTTTTQTGTSPFSGTRGFGAGGFGIQRRVGN